MSQFLQHLHTKNPLTSRLVYLDNWDHVQFNLAEQSKKLQDKVQESYDKKLKTLSNKITQLEAQGKSQDDIKAAIKAEKAKMIQESIDQALRELKINKRDNGRSEPVTYLDLVNSPEVSSKIEPIFKNLNNKADADVDTAVDQYFSKKGVATQNAKGGLLAIPKATQTTDLDSANPETAKLQDVLDRRKGILEGNRAKRNEVLGSKAEAYKTRTTAIDSFTSPEGGKIDDYDDGIWPNGINDFNAPTRLKLNGYLYANDIFAGGGKAGDAAVQKALEEPYKLYYTLIGDSRFTIKHLEQGMNMKSYFEDASKYTTLDRPAGVVAGLLRLADQNLKDANIHNRYIEYLRQQFELLKAPDKAQNEDLQLKHLFGIKSISEFLNIDPTWKEQFAKIKTLTDPDRSGPDVISDYPGTGKDNAENKTRYNLNGYLFSQYILSGRSEGMVKVQYDRAAKMFKDSGIIDQDFTQKHIEDEKTGFGLAKYLPQAEAFSRNETVKGAIAGLLKYAEGLPKAEGESYKAYLVAKFKLINSDDSEENQLMYLSTIKPKLEADKEMVEDYRTSLIEYMLKATQQHNKLVFKPEWQATFDPQKDNADLEALKKRGTAIKLEIDNFVSGRADAALKDLEDKYKVLKTNNDVQKKPVYDESTLSAVRLKVETLAKQLVGAKGVLQVAELGQAIDGKYLSTLSNAEKEYQTLGKELDARIAQVKSGKAVGGGSGSKASTGASGGVSAGPSEGGENAPESTDPYKANWSKAERVDSGLQNYQGTMITNSGADGKVIARDFQGTPIATLKDGVEVNRTEKDSGEKSRYVENLHFVRVTLPASIAGGKKAWIPEEQLDTKG
ncbi:hypothetical protein IT412_02005 [Candidatus Peregrinibacteria bacterium]|nr:hypothetical protein [Candidatus Peregrinibacteria bacterium]